MKDRKEKVNFGKILESSPVKAFGESETGERLKYSSTTALLQFNTNPHKPI